MHRFVPAVCFFLVATALTAAVPQPADEPLDEIIVTASLDASPLERLPASATVVRSADLDAAGLSHFGDVLSLIPNLGFAGGTSRPRYFQIRGIGELEQYEGAPNPSVGFLIDDIDFSGIAMPASLFDLQQAEVLRGPQGTTYGANALAGLISLRSESPQDHFALKGELEAGDYHTLGAGLVLNDTVGEGGTAYRLSVHRFTSDGFRRNDFLKRTDTNGFDETLARLRVRSALTADLDLNVTALVGDSRNGYDAWSIDNSRVTQSDKPGVDNQLSRALALRLDYRGFNGFNLRSITTFLSADMDYSFDGDWGNNAFWGVNAPYDFTEQIERRRRNLSQEIRLQSKDATAKTRWVAGVYGLTLLERYDFLDLYNGDVYRTLQSHYRATNVAAYAQVEHRLTPAMTLSGGLRLEQRDARYRDRNDLDNKPRDTMLGGHLSLGWQVAEGRDAYAALTRGYKAGGINTGIELPPGLRLYDPEFLWNAEVGLKTRSANQRFDSRTSVFYMRRTDQQVSSSYQRDPQNPLDFLLLTDNAARGENFGLESEMGWWATPALRLGTTMALLKARFVDYSVGLRVLDGRDQPHAPHYQWGLNLDWHAANGWFARADWQAVDGFYFSASHDQRADRYQLLNLRAGFATRQWSANVWARNVLNEQYAVRGFFFGNEPPDFADKRYTQNGDPRQVGVKFSLSLN
jgi:iron complex outermembrane recepter protein